MRKFVVPQFIDVESKIIGPITARQFIIVIVSGIFLFIVYRLSSFGLFVFQAIGIALIGGSLAFLKINGNPFHIFLLNIFTSLRRPAVRVWQKETHEDIRQPKNQPAPAEADVFVPKQSLAPGKLSELALIVDTGGMYRGEEEANFINQTVYGQRKKI